MFDIIISQVIVVLYNEADYIFFLAEYKNIKYIIIAKY